MEAKKAIQTIVGWLGWGFMHFISKMILKGEGKRSAVLKKNRLIPPTAKAWQGVEGYISIRIAHVCPTKERKCPFSKFRAILFLCGKWHLKSLPILFWLWTPLKCLFAKDMCFSYELVIDSLISMFDQISFSSKIFLNIYKCDDVQIIITSLAIYFHSIHV